MDYSLKGLVKMLKENPEGAEQLTDDIIRNTYRTLMTHGQKGYFIFCTDNALEEYLRERIDRVSHSYQGNEFFRSPSRNTTSIVYKKIPCIDLVENQAV